MVAAGGTQQPVGSDLGEPLGEHVLKEACDEVGRGERHAAGVPTAGVGVAEGDSSSPLAALDAVVGEGDPKDVAREVEGGVLAAADLLDVNVPGLLEDFRREVPQ
jgi:hypothetical protein